MCLFMWHNDSSLEKYQTVNSYVKNKRTVHNERLLGLNWNSSSKHICQHDKNTKLKKLQEFWN
jgi:hypothetical protein